MIVQASIPDFLIHQAEEVARREGTTVDSIISIALSSQVTAGKSATPSNNAPLAGKWKTSPTSSPTFLTLLPHLGTSAYE